jgi:hypothetical protein
MKKFTELYPDEQDQLLNARGMTSARRFLKRELPHLSDAEIDELIDDLLRVSDEPLKRRVRPVIPPDERANAQLKRIREGALRDPHPASGLGRRRCAARHRFMAPAELPPDASGTSAGGPRGVRSAEPAPCRTNPPTFGID